MKKVRICFEVQGMATDNNGNLAPAGLEFTLGEVSDEKYAEIDYFEATKDATGLGCLRGLGMEHLAANHTEDDFRIISPEEYDEKYGKGNNL